MFSKSWLLILIFNFTVVSGGSIGHATGEQPYAVPIESCPNLLTRLFAKLRLNPEAPVAGPLTFNFPPHVGTPTGEVRIRNLEMHVEGANYHDLGAGGGGIVVRVEPPPGSPPFILKQFFASGRREFEDRATAQLLRDSKNVKTKIQILRSTPIGKQSSRIDDVQGQTLQNLLKSETLSPSERAHLLREWNEFVRGVRGNVHKSRRMISGVYNQVEVLKYQFEKNGVYGEVFLKPDNVIVESGTGRMYINDAY